MVRQSWIKSPFVCGIDNTITTVNSLLCLTKNSITAEWLIVNSILWIESAIPLRPYTINHAWLRCLAENSIIHKGTICIVTLERVCLRIVLWEDKAIQSLLPCLIPSSLCWNDNMICRILIIDFTNSVDKFVTLIHYRVNIHFLSINDTTTNACILIENILIVRSKEFAMRLELWK